MGLFSKSKARINNVELANQAFNTFGVGGEIEEAYKMPVEKFLGQFDTRINALKGIAELCVEDKSSKALYIKSMAYFWAGASCREEAIKSALEYLENPTWTGLPDDIIEMEGFKVKRRDSLIGTFYGYLAQAYEGEQEFDKALEAYETQQSLEPYSWGCKRKIADVYRKMNNLDMAISILEEAKKNPLLKPRKWKSQYGGEYITTDYTGMFDSMLEDYKAKRNKGYIYRPRKSK